MKNIRTLWMVVLGLLFSQSILAQNSPIPLLQNSADQIVAALKEHKSELKSNPKIINQVVQKNLLPIVDVNGMSRSVLGQKIWSSASAAQKAAFSQAFTELVIRTYASPLAEYTDEKIKFLPIRGDTQARFIRVNSLIVRSNGNNIPLSYSLVSINGQWKIYDLSVEGVSLLQSFRSQFAQALQGSDIDALIQQMRQRSKAS